MNIDWSVFWQLGGHGLYVWPGYGAALLLVLLEAVVMLRRLRAPARKDEA